MKKLTAFLLVLGLLVASVFGAENSIPEGHPYHLTVHNGSGDGDYYEGGTGLTPKVGHIKSEVLPVGLLLLGLGCLID